MNFVLLLRSLDDLLYELMSWLIFFPVTLWGIIRRPVAMMDYAEDQFRLEPEKQFRTTVTPPIMLILSLVLCQGIEINLVGTNPIVKSHHGLANLVNDDGTLLMLRLLLFGLFPVFLAARLLRKSDRVFDRDNLKPHFYAQCYPIALFALMLSLGTSLALHEHFPLLRLVGVALVIVAFVQYATIQSWWFTRKLGLSATKGIIYALTSLAESVAITILVGLLFVP